MPGVTLYTFAVNPLPEATTDLLSVMIDYFAGSRTTYRVEQK